MQTEDEYVDPPELQLPQYALIDKLPSYTMRTTTMLCIDTEVSKRAGMSVNRDRQILTRPRTYTKDRYEVYFPMWFLNMFPSRARNRILLGALFWALHEIDPREVKMGQVDVYKPRMMTAFRFTNFELLQISKVGKRARMSKYASIIRTVIFWAFGVPGALEGIISPPKRRFKISTTLMNEMIIRGNTMTLNEYRLAIINGPPIEVYELPRYNKFPWSALCLKKPDDNDDSSLFYRFLSDARQD